MVVEHKQVFLGLLQFSQRQKKQSHELGMSIGGTRDLRKKERRGE